MPKRKRSTPGNGNGRPSPYPVRRENCLKHSGDFDTHSKPLKHPLAMKLSRARTIPQILAALHIDEWDYLIVGDGSATTWDHAAGWGSTLVSNREGPERLPPFHGSLSCGTNIMAEMLAFIHPLLWLANQKDLPGRTVVHVLTDCEYVRDCGEGRAVKKANRELWFLVQAFDRKGLVVRYHWVPRDILDLNKLAHDLANAARLAAKEHVPVKDVIRRFGKNIHRVNPL